MQIKIVYFANLIPNKWESIVQEQLNYLKSLDLYNIAINIYFSAISNKTEILKLQKLLNTKYNKIQLKNIYEDNVYEYPGIKTIYQIAEDDDNTILLYFHSKGITSNQHDIRRYLMENTIKNYQEAINEFKKNKFLDVVCAIPHKDGFAYFNFFWTRSSYVRNYCSRPEVSDNRYIWEVWIGTEFSRKKKIVTFSPIIKYDTVQNQHEVWNLQNKTITKTEYIPTNEELSKIELKELEFESKISEPSRISNNIKSKKTLNPDVINPDVINPNVINPDVINPDVINPDVIIYDNIKFSSRKPSICSTPKCRPLCTSQKSNLGTTTHLGVEQIEGLSEASIKTKINKEIKIVKEETKIVKEFIKHNILDSCNPYQIFEYCKNKGQYVLQIGMSTGLDTYMLGKRFKKVIGIEENSKYYIRLDSNIRTYCNKNIIVVKKKLVMKKKENKNMITFKEIIYNYIVKPNEKLGLICCDLNQDDILEEIFNFAFINKIRIFIKFSIDNIKNYHYLFHYFNYNEKLLEKKTWMLFEPKVNNELQIIKKNMPIIIIGFNQYTYISKMVKQLENYTKDIIIIDNGSTFKPLLKYYDEEYKYTLLKMDSNHGHKVYEDKFVKYLVGDLFIITDPDLEFNKNLPKNYISELIKISNEYKAGRVGFALLIDAPDIRTELSYASLPIKEWEGRFWKNKINHPYLELYNAPIDTTFCLLNTIHNKFGLTIRIAGNYTCKHLPWHHYFYKDLLKEEYDYYLLNNKSTNFWKDDNKDNNDVKIVNDNIDTNINNNYSRISIEGVDSDDENIDMTILERVKNIKGVAINIGPELDLDKYFKKVIQEQQLFTTIRQFIFDKVDINDDIKYLNINLNGQEEEMLEEILHICYINNIKLTIDVNNYKNLDKYKYLLDFFVCSKINNLRLLEVNNDYCKDFIKKNMPCVIIGYNQLTYIKLMVTQLEKYTNDIIIIDNNSSYSPLIEYYRSEYKYTLLKQKENYGHKVYEKNFMNKIVGDMYILTDPDIEFNKEMPDNWIESLVKISNYFQAEKTGLALLYDAPDIRTDCICFGKNIYDWESQYWIYKFYYKNFEIYSAALDTSTCLVNKQNKNSGHYRVAGNFLAKHLPWHKNFEKNIPKDEYDCYLKNNISSNYFKLSKK